MAYSDAEVEIMKPLEVLWTRVKEASESRLKQAKDSIEVETEIIELAKRKIEEDKL